MKLEESLTKENFWNEMQEKYPNAMKIFCNWIDEYKKFTNWDKLFAVQVKYNKEGRIDSNVKFHDLPHAMQLGIWLIFEFEQGDCFYEITPYFKLRNAIFVWMDIKEKALK